jgi:hypothetical protein
MRRHLTYANVAATLALVFAMTGGALAAKHYLINSTSQISPKVLKKLRGATGKTGASGAQGRTGPQGPVGTSGALGPIGPSNVYSADTEPFVNLQFPENPTVASVAVPAGSYVVTAQMQVIDETSERQDAGCELANDVNADHAESQVTVEPLEGKHYNGHAVISVQASSTLAAAGHWLLKCSGSANKEVLRGEKAQINAIQVGALSRAG